MEWDVQLTADGGAVVFQDSPLARMAGVQGRVADHTAEELGRMRLAGGEETIPTLADSLALVGHRAMVHIEIKSAFGDVGRLERRVHEGLIDPNGPTCLIGLKPSSPPLVARPPPQVLPC